MAYIGNQADTAFTSLIKQDLTGASGTSLTLTHAVANANDIALYINNVRQEPVSAYSTNGTAVSLTGSVVSSDDIYVIYLARAVQTTVPPDGSVSTAKIADSAVTNAKINNSTIDLTSKVTGVLPNVNIIGQAVRPSFLVANLNGTTFNSGVLTGADASGYGFTNGGMSYVASSGELTVPIAGLYTISAGVFLNTGSGRGEGAIQIKTSGGSFYPVVMSDGNATSTYDSINLVINVVLSANDVLRIKRQTGTAYTANHPTNYFNVVYIGA